MSSTPDFATALEAARLHVTSPQFPEQHRARASKILVVLNDMTASSKQGMLNNIASAKQRNNSKLSEGDILALAVLDQAKNMSYSVDVNVMAQGKVNGSFSGFTLKASLKAASFEEGAGKIVGGLDQDSSASATAYAAKSVVPSSARR